MTKSILDSQIQTIGNITYGFYGQKISGVAGYTYSVHLRRATETYRDVYVVEPGTGSKVPLYSQTSPVEIVNTSNEILGFQGLVFDNVVYLVYVEKVIEGEVTKHKLKVAPSFDYGVNFKKPCRPFGSDMYATSIEDIPEDSEHGVFPTYVDFEAVLQGEDILVYYRNEAEVIVIRNQGKW
ncbi:MAG: hypothetical protein P0116_16930 [Candidatus Nitrosocosmicus sp.]|nr:hypothetical protein [Candidatus Nitrosocosmicus sp.]